MSSGGPSADARPPLVSVTTPVFNGEKYLGECIESVLAQSYDNWEYTVVDNCSTDRSLAIACEYAAAHPRIKVIRNDQFVGAIENHNRAFRSISAEARYCKLLSADDWLYPECIAKLVDLAERHPSVGIVGSYATDGIGVRWGHLPLDREIFAGHEAARLYLLGKIDTFWVPSSVLYRASIVRASDQFFPRDSSSADLEACLRSLKDSDLGFVHQILSYQRLHDDAITSRVGEMNGELLDRAKVLVEFGPEFLAPAEQRERLDEQVSEYFEVLAGESFRIRDREFWRRHRAGLHELGYSIGDRRFAKAVAARFLDLTLNPRLTTQKVVKRVAQRH
jgi:glycosyltransferase involved in cell wall biosynthesis